MKEEKFKVIQYIRELIINIDRNLDNFPKKDIELKNRIRTNSYDLLELVYEANSTREKERKLEILDKTIAKFLLYKLQKSKRYSFSFIINVYL